MLLRLLRPSAFKVALLIGVGFAGLHFLRRTGWAPVTFLEVLEEKSIDLKFRFRGPRAPSHQVALVEVDERAIQQQGLWPWNHAVIAEAIDRMAKAGPSAIALDMVFSEPDRDSSFESLSRAKARLLEPAQDYEPKLRAALSRVPPRLRRELGPVLETALTEHEALQANHTALNALVADAPDAVLARVIERWSNLLVLGVFPIDEEGVRSIAPELVAKWDRAARGSLEPGGWTYLSPGRARPLPRQVYWRMPLYAGVHGWYPALASAEQHYGSFAVSGDRDGTIRHYAPVAQLHEGFLPSLAVAAAARASANESSGFAFQALRDPGNHQGLEGIALNWRGDERIVPTDAFHGSRALINYFGPSSLWRSRDDRPPDGEEKCSGVTCDRVSMADVLAGSFDPASLKGKLVFVNVTATGTFDHRVTPFDPFCPGVFIHMNVAEDIVTGRFIEDGSYMLGYELGLLLALAIALGLLLPRIGLAGQLATLPVGTSGALGASVYAFNHGTNLFTVTPMLEIVALIFGVVFFQYFSTDKEKRQVRQAFQYYLTESVMTEMLADPSKLKLGGVKKELTVMFSDIRGFTTLSEMLEASEVARTLNEYLTPMTNLVFQTGGTLDKYMGDAIMAFWGAPLDQADHALKACQTACAMIERLDVMRAEWKQKGRPDIDIGIGLNSGNIHVGNMGSDIRFDYTVIGDDVNLASRLEGTNKSYGTRIILGENTYRLVQGQVVARELGGVVVKGKKKPVTIFELRRMGSPTADEARAIAAFERGLAAYRRRDWDAAAQAFGEVMGVWPGDGPSEKYLDDLAEKRAHPPDAGWDGVYVMKTK